MKVTKTENSKDNMTPAQREALAQFEASARLGQVVFHPWVGPNTPAPHCVALPEGLTRIAVTYLDGEYWVEDGQWYRRDDKGAATPIDDMLEPCWQAAMAVRSRLSKEKGINAYVVGVAVFTDMEPDASIMAAAANRGARVLFGMDDHVERLAGLPEEKDLKHPLKARYIPDDVAVLSRRPEGAEAVVEPETASLDVGDGSVVIHAGAVHIDIHLHFTIALSDDGDNPSLTVQVQ